MRYWKAGTGTSQTCSKLFSRSQFAARFLWRERIDNWGFFFLRVLVLWPWTRSELKRKEWICLTPIFGLCSQTLLCLIWGVGTGYGEHKGKNVGILCLQRECVAFRGSLTAGAALETGSVCWLTVWKVYSLTEGINQVFSSWISWGILMNVLLRVLLLLKCG